MQNERRIFAFTVTGVALVFLLQIVFFLLEGHNPVNEGTHNYTTPIQFTIIRLTLYGLLTLLVSLPAVLPRSGSDSKKRILFRYAYLFLLTGTIVFMASEYIDELGIIQCEKLTVAPPVYEPAAFPHEKGTTACCTSCRKIVSNDPHCSAITGIQSFATLLFGIGNIFFYFMHIAFTSRHRLTNKSPEVNKKFYTAALITCSACTVIVFFLRGFFKVEFTSTFSFIFLLLSCLIYAFFIVKALYAAYKTWNNPTFSKIQSLLIIMGYTFFIFCEIIVITGIISGRHLESKEFSTFFYAPAFLFLALSSFTFENDLT